MRRAESHVVWEACPWAQMTRQTRSFTSLPNVLNIHCNVSTDAQLDLWRTPTKPKGGAVGGGSWLPLFLRVAVDSASGKVVATDVSRE